MATNTINQIKVGDTTYGIENTEVVKKDYNLNIGYSSDIDHIVIGELQGGSLPSSIALYSDICHIQTNDYSSLILGGKDSTIRIGNYYAGQSSLVSIAPKSINIGQLNLTEGTSTNDIAMAAQSEISIYSPKEIKILSPLISFGTQNDDKALFKISQNHGLIVSGHNFHLSPETYPNDSDVSKSLRIIPKISTDGTNHVIGVEFYLGLHEVITINSDGTITTTTI